MGRVVGLVLLLTGSQGVVESLWRMLAQAGGPSAPGLALPALTPWWDSVCGWGTGGRCRSPTMIGPQSAQRYLFLHWQAR